MTEVVQPAVVDLEIQQCLGQVVKQPTLIITTDPKRKVEIIQFISSYLLQKYPDEPVLVLMTNEIKNLLQTVLKQKNISFLDLKRLGKRSPLSYTGNRVLLASYRVIYNDIKKEFLQEDTTTDNYQFSAVFYTEASNALDSKALYLIQQYLNKVCRHKIGLTNKTNTKKLLEISKKLDLDLIEPTTTSRITRIDHVMISLSEDYYLLRHWAEKYSEKFFERLVNSGYLSSNRPTKQELFKVHELLKNENNVRLLRISTFLIHLLNLMEIMTSQGLDIAYEWLQEKASNYQNVRDNSWYFFINDPVIKQFLTYLKEHRHPHPRLEKTVLLVNQLPEKRLAIICQNSILRTHLINYLQKKVTDRPILGIIEPLATLQSKTRKRVFETLSTIENFVIIANTINNEILRYIDHIILFTVNSKNIEGIIALANISSIKTTAIVAKGTNEEYRFFALTRRKSKKKIKAKEINKELSTLKAVTRSNDISQSKEEKLKIELIMDPRLYRSSVPFDFNVLKKKDISVIEKELALPGILTESNQFIFFLYNEFLSEFIIDNTLTDFCKIINDNYPQTTIIIPFTEQFKQLSANIKKVIFDQIYQYSFKVYVGSLSTLSKIIISLVNEITITKKNDIADSRFIELLKVVPGVNSFKAKNIINIYPTINSLISATQDEIKDVMGVGPKLAEEIKKYFY